MWNERKLDRRKFYILFTATTCAMERLYFPKSVYNDFKRLRLHFASEEQNIPVKTAEDNVEDDLLRNVVTQDDDLPESPQKKARKK